MTNIERLKFEIFDKIGHGQFSTVYRAKWINPPEVNDVPLEVYHQNGAATFITPQQHQQRLTNHPVDQTNDLKQKTVPNAQTYHNNQQYQHNHCQLQPSISAHTNNTIRNDRFVALKRIKFYDIQNSTARINYLKEVNLLQQVKHPNIINFNISFIERNELYIVLELADGGDLSKLIRYFQKKNRLIPEQSILKYFTQVCSAVEYIHSKRILHRDIKPANIFMTSSGCVKLGDFGLGRFFSQNTRDAHSIVGTFYYMSPERIQESGYSFSSDVWSLGCVLYELITLHSPFSILNNEQQINNYNACDGVRNKQTMQQNQISKTEQQHFQQQNNPYNLQWLIDRIIRAEYPSLDNYKNVSARLRHLANECLDPNQDNRPNMQYVCGVVNEVYQICQQISTPPMTPPL